MRSQPKQTSLKYHLSHLIITTTIATLLLFQSSQSGNADWKSEAGPQEKNTWELGVDKPVERELAGGGAHQYQLMLTVGQYLQIAVKQSGIDLIATVFDPEGKEICRVDLASDASNPETIYLIAKLSGNYRLEMRVPDNGSTPGQYLLKIEALRIATRPDERRANWYEIFAEGAKLKAQATAESLQAAVLKYQEAFHYLRDLDDPTIQAETLGGLGDVYYLLGERKKALDAFLQELTLWRKTGDRGRESSALNNVGIVYDTLGDRLKALEYLDQSLQLQRAIGDRNGESATLNNIGGTYKQLGDLQKALDYYNQSLVITRTLGNRQAEALGLNNIGSIYDDLGEKQKALDHFTQSLATLRILGDRRGEAALLNNIGSIYDDLGEKQKALDGFNQSLSLARATGYRSLEALLLNNLGLAYNSIGEKQKALDHYNQSLPIFRAVADPDGEAMVLNNFGLTYKYLGEFQKALDYYNQSLQLGQATGNRDGEALALNNIGGVYGALGEREKALDYLFRALELRQKIGVRNGVAVTLNNIGALHYLSGDKQKALTYYHQALPIYREVGNRNGEASTLTNIGLTLDSAGDKQKALGYFEQSLRLNREVEDSQGQATALNNMGSIYIDLGEEQKALESLHPALQLNRAVGNRSGEARALHNFARLEQRRGNLIEARLQIEAALRIIESLRSKLNIQELRASYLASVQDYYEFYIALLSQMDQAAPSNQTAGYQAAALEASELARARSLLEILAEAKADIRQGVHPQLLERERALQEQLSARASVKTALLNRKQTATHLAREIDDLTTRLQEVKAEIRASSPRYAALTQPQPLKVREIQQQMLDHDTILLEYFLGRKQSYLWAVTPTSIDIYRLPPRAEIEDAARQTYNLLTARAPGTGKGEADGRMPAIDADSKYWSQAALLSRMVLGPVASKLGQKRLVIVPDGALQYIPFAALPAPPVPNDEDQKPGGDPQPLVVEHEIVNLPSISILAELRREMTGRRPAEKSVAVLADPVFAGDDTRVRRNKIKVSSRAGEQSTNSETVNVVYQQMARSGQETGVIGAEPRFGRLLGTRREAAAILALVPEVERRQFLDFEASRSTALSPQLSQYRIVHFATHGLLNNIHPELSGIVLSLVDERGNPQNGFLQLHDIYNLKLPAELVVLSGCQTGLGKEIKGEGLIGLTRGFMYAGTPRVIASLWNVDDQATSELMKHLYRGLFGAERLRPAEALRQAQLSILKQKQWRAPYYWAAFVLQGEWR